MSIQFRLRLSLFMYMHSASFQNSQSVPEILRYTLDVVFPSCAQYLISNLFSQCDYFCHLLSVQVTFGSVNENSITHLTMLNYLEEIKVAASETRPMSGVST